MRNFNARRRQEERRRLIGLVMKTIGAICIGIGILSLFGIAGASDVELYGVVSNYNIMSGLVLCVVSVLIGIGLYEFPKKFWE